MSVALHQQFVGFQDLNVDTFKFGFSLCHIPLSFSCATTRIENLCIDNFSIHYIFVLGVCSSMQNDKDYIDVLRRELYDTKLNFEREKKEIEQSYKMEITKIEEIHDQEKADLLQNIRRDQVRKGRG